MGSSKARGWVWPITIFGAFMAGGFVGWLIPQVSCCWYRQSPPGTASSRERPFLAGTVIVIPNNAMSGEAWQADLLPAQEARAVWEAPVRLKGAEVRLKDLLQEVEIAAQRPLYWIPSPPTSQWDAAGQFVFKRVTHAEGEGWSETLPEHTTVGEVLHKVLGVATEAFAAPVGAAMLDEQPPGRPIGRAVWGAAVSDSTIFVMPLWYDESPEFETRKNPGGSGDMIPHLERSDQ